MDKITKLKDYFNNLSHNTYYLSNKDFKYGTYRIIKPGLYKLTENIVFEPNKNSYLSMNPASFNNILDNFRPLNHQKRYKKPPYHLGFFAAITIESDDVILDLNGYSIQQSQLHYINQRFFSLIELNEAPFIKKQGPSDFGDINYPKNIYIKNGYLKLSSHHGIHGNNNDKILIENLDISKFEVAGIQLNGCENSCVYNVKIHDNSIDTKVSLFYSNAINTRFFLKQLVENKTIDRQVITINGKERTALSIFVDLQKALIDVNKSIIDKKIIKSKFYRNVDKLPEGNIYGIVLNTTGVVVNDFLDNDNAKKNKNNVVNNIKIYNLISKPKQIITLSEGKKFHQGVIGDNIPYLKLCDTNFFYKENELYNSIAIIAKFTNNTRFIHRSKSLNIPEYIINEWISGEKNLLEIKTNYNLYCINLRDSMNHLMKGNIALFVSGSERLEVANINIKNIYNFDEQNNHNDKLNLETDFNYVANNETMPNYKIQYKKYMGNNINAITVVQSNKIIISNISCSDMHSKEGLCNGIKYINSCSDIINNNINITENTINDKKYIEKINFMINHYTKNI